MNNTYPSITKFQQFVELKDYRPPTKKEYVRYVRKCAEHFGCDPLTLTEDQLRGYFLFLRQEKHYSRSPMKAAKFSLRSFFVDCHKVSGWTVFAEVRIAEPLILPVVLSRQEVAAVLGAVRQSRMGVYLELSQYLGHASLDTTVIYTHLTSISEARTRAALETLHRAVTTTSH